MSYCAKLSGDDLSHYLNKSLRCRWQTRATQCLSACQIFRIASYGNQTIWSTRPSCWVQISTSVVINSCPTTIRRLGHSPANQVDSAWDDQPCPPKFKWFTWPNQAPFWDGLPVMLTRTWPSRPRPGPRTQASRPRTGPMTCFMHVPSCYILHGNTFQQPKVTLV